MKQRVNFILGVSILILVFASRATAGDGVDNRIYADLLKKHVIHANVNYDGFKKEEKQLDEYLALLGRVDARSLSRNSRFAFYINAYNAFTIKLVLTRYPGINSIKEIGGFFSNPWSINFIPLQGKTVSLDHIEHDILRPEFKDPRIQFAINCAAKSSPALLDRPYEGDTLETQLDEQTKKFINDKKFNFLKGDTLFISKIFKWFEADFSDNPIFFIRTHAQGELKEKLLASEGKMTIRYLNYDWSLNR